MTATAQRPHRVATAVTSARSLLGSVAGESVWSMDPDETTSTLEKLTALAAQVAELQARVLAHADRTEVAALSGTSKTGNWLAHHTKLDRRTAFAAMRLAT